MNHGQVRFSTTVTLYCGLPFFSPPFSFFLLFFSQNNGKSEVDSGPSADSRVNSAPTPLPSPFPPPFPSFPLPSFSFFLFPFLSLDEDKEGHYKTAADSRESSSRSLRLLCLPLPSPSSSFPPPFSLPLIPFSYAEWTWLMALIATSTRCGTQSSSPRKYSSMRITIPFSLLPLSASSAFSPSSFFLPFPSNRADQFRRRFPCGNVLAIILFPL